MASPAPEESAMHALLRRLPWIALAVAGVGTASDSNIPWPVAELEQRLRSEPMEIVHAEAARGIKEDVALRTDVRFTDGAELRIKIRPAEPGAATFNNEPRYELAAYILQQAFLDEPEFVVPPTVLRMLPRAELLPHAPRTRPTFRGADEVLVVVQYWLQQVSNRGDPWDPRRFASDPIYARHVANLNVLTFLIRHGDSNAGNILASAAPEHPRAFAVDNGVAFGSPASDRGTAWRELRVSALPARTVERLRALDAEALRQRLSVLATWRLEQGRWVSQPGAPRLSGDVGVRIRQDQVQLGLTRREILAIDQRRRQLLRRVDRGELEVF
jgi:hypothetical protein